jgi:cytidyltransferase-like protein
MNKNVISNGCFDVVHAGHIGLLNYCKKLAGDDGSVIIALDADEKITKDKGINRPIFTYLERCYVLQTLGVNIIVKFYTNEELYEWIKYFNPVAIVKSSDWRGNVVGSDICKVEYFPLDSRFSTTKIVERVLSRYSKMNYYDEYF